MTTYLERVKKLPEGTQSRTIAAAHRIADEKRHEHIGPGAVNASLRILFYDEETWEQAFREVAMTELGMFA